MASIKKNWSSSLCYLMTSIVRKYIFLVKIDVDDLQVSIELSGFNRTFSHKTTFRASFSISAFVEEGRSVIKSRINLAQLPQAIPSRWFISSIYLQLAPTCTDGDPRPRVIINCSFNSHVRNGPTVHPIDSVCPSNPSSTFTRVKLSPSLFSILSFIFVFVVFETGCHDEFVVLLRLRLRFGLVKGRTFRFPNHWCASMQPVCKVLHP